MLKERLSASLVDKVNKKLLALEKEPTKEDLLGEIATKFEKKTEKLTNPANNFYYKKLRTGDSTFEPEDYVEAFATEINADYGNYCAR